MAVKHIVLLRFKPETSEEQIQQFFKDLKALRDELSTLQRNGFSAGRYNSKEGLHKEFTHGFIMTFADANERDQYLEHPQHKAIAKDIVACLQAFPDGVIVFDFSDDAGAATPRTTIQMARAVLADPQAYDASFRAELAAKLTTLHAAVMKNPGKFNRQVSLGGFTTTVTVKDVNSIELSTMISQLQSEDVVTAAAPSLRSN